MPKRGALNPVYAIDDADLEANGGRWKLAGHTAIPVRGYTSLNVGSRQVKQGAAKVVWPISASDLKGAGGNFRLQQGRPLSVMDMLLPAGTTLGSRNLQEGPAIPVYPVSDDIRTFDPTWPAGYAGKVLTTESGNLIGYWIMDEASGAIAIDSSPEGNDGAYTGVTLGQPGIGDGRTCPLFDGANDFNNIYSAAFNADFDGDELTLAGWLRVNNVGVWTDGVQRYGIHLRNNAANRSYLAKSSVNNSWIWVHAGGGVNNNASVAGQTSTDWMHLALTVTDTGDEIRFYIDGSQIGATVNGVGTFVGNLNATLTAVGAVDIVPNNVWDGLLAHWTVWTTVLTPTQIANLAVV